MNSFFHDRKLFLDATVLISGTTLVDPASNKLLYTYDSGLLYSNEYCVTETRRYFQYKLAYPPHDTNNVIELIRSKARIIPTAQAKDFQKLELPDKLKSDKPVVKGALDINAVLITHDGALLREAKKYVQTARPEELFSK